MTIEPQIVRDDTTNGVDVNSSEQTTRWLSTFEAKWSRLETFSRWAAIRSQKSTVEIDKNIKSGIRDHDGGEKSAKTCPSSVWTLENNLIHFAPEWDITDFIAEIACSNN